ncbi:MAG TPA: hypothetical protein VLK36_15470 [Gaiellaceae bacterium]|nr:hypothetical protein [Gaiellaceae bacterium]
MGSPTCSHLDQIALTDLPAEIDGCEKCLKTGDRWLHLRMCTSCGKCLVDEVAFAAG